MTKADIQTIIAELRELEAAATQGEWRHVKRSQLNEPDSVMSANGIEVVVSGATRYNARCIVALRNAAPRLLAYIAELEQERDSADEWGQIQGQCVKELREERDDLAARLREAEAQRDSLYDLGVEAMEAANRCEELEQENARLRNDSKSDLREALGRAETRELEALAEIDELRAEVELLREKVRE